jgi:16S rRNA (guanine527-N7)-methyltransferase
MQAQMTSERIAELLAPFLGGTTLSPIQVGQVSTFLDLLLKWNAKMNLTAVRDPEQIITRHFGESLFAAKNVLSAGSAETAIDVGSGAGFPGLALKIWGQQLQLTLVESNHKKAIFLREGVRALQLLGVTVLTERAERLKVKAQLVSLRAVERFEAVLPVARGLLAPGGRLVALIGRTQSETAKRLVTGISWQPPLAVPNSEARVLLVGTHG